MDFIYIMAAGRDRQGFGGIWSLILLSIALFPACTKTQTAEYLTVEVGSRFSLSCSSPSYMIFWLYNEDAIPIGSNVMVLNRRQDDVTTSQLVVFATTHANAGTYSCQALDDDGATYSAFVTVVDVTGPVDFFDILLGDPFTLNCTGDAGQDLSWFLNGNIFHPGENSAILNFPSEHEMRSELRVHAAGVQDGGYITCQPRDDARVLYRANVVIDDRTESMRAEVGSHIALSCTSQSPAISWLYNGGPVPTYDNIVIQNHRLDQLTTSQLVVLAARRENAGIYSCQEMGGPGNIYAVSITVVDVTGPVELYEVMLADPLTLVCLDDDGRHVEWFLNGSRVDGADDGVSIVTVPSGHVTRSELRLQATREQDFGHYTCQPVEDVSVLYRTNVMPTRGKESLTVEVGSRFSLTCTSPSSVIVWLHNDAMIPIGNNIMVLNRRQDDVTTSQLVVFATTPGNAGNYSCQGFGDTSRILSTSVTVVNITGPVDDFYVNLDDNLTLVCTGGEASRDLDWFLNGTLLYSNEDLLIVSLPSDNGTSSELRISAARPRDVGYYTCQPRDDERVLYRANVNVNDVTESLTVEVGSQLTLSCAGPDVQATMWLHNGHQVSTGRNDTASIRIRRHPDLVTSQLVISPIRLNDSGIYSCQGSGEDGSAYKASITVVPVTGPVDTYVMDVGDPFTLFCTDEVGRDILWLLNASAVYTEDNSFIYTYTLWGETRSELRVHAARMRDAGYYTCQPIDVAQVLYRANVTVNDRTDVVQPVVERLHVELGSDLSLTCRDYLMRTSLAWTHVGAAVPARAQTAKYFEAPFMVSELSVTGLQAREDGNYSCVADGGSSLVYTALVTFDEVDETVPPILDTITVGLGSDFSLTCVDASLRGLDWLHNGTQITADGSHGNVRFTDSIRGGARISELTVVNAHARNAGDYACKTVSQCDAVVSTSVKIRLQ